MSLRAGLMVACVTVLVMGCKTTPPPPPKAKLLQIDARPDASQVFYFQNGVSCLKRADYTKFIKTDNALKVKELFEAKVSFEQKMEKARELSPQFQELEASFFDICYEYGEERVSKEYYLEQRRIYDSIRQKSLTPKVETEPTPPPPPPAVPKLDEACRKEKFDECMRRYPPVYPTVNQQCNDPRTHYLVKRTNKEMPECYGLPPGMPYGDCVGKCIRWDAVATEICDIESRRVCTK